MKGIRSLVLFSLIPALFLCPARTFAVEQGSSLNIGLIPVVRITRISWNEEVLILDFSCLKEVDYLNVKLEEDKEEIEEISYFSNDRIQKTVGFQRVLRILYSDGTNFQISYRKENYRPERKNSLKFVLTFLGSSDPLFFHYQIVKEGEELNITFPGP